MKLVIITYRFEYQDRVEAMLRRAGVRDFLLIARAQGGDADGLHYGSQVHPGHLSQVQAQAEDQAARELLRLVGEFKQEKQAHRHVTALCLEVADRA